MATGRTGAAPVAIATVACLLLGASAHAAVRYAEPGGNGPETTCPKKNPCELRDAARGPSVEDGDEVVVLPGTYDLGNGNLELSEAINLHGALGGPRPVITSTAGNGTTLDGGGAERIHDLVFESFDDNPIYGALGTGGGGTAVVERVVAISDNAPGCNGSPLAPGVLRDTVCATAGNGAALAASEAGSAFNFTLRNISAIGYGTASLGIRYEITNGALTVDARNVIARGGGAGIDVVAAATTGAVTINLAHSNYLSRETSGTATITDPATSDNQTVPPKLADPDGGDFHQLSDSPTIDAGGGPADVDLLGELDFERQPRVQGAAPDIGADEFDDFLKLKAKAKKHQKARKLKVKASCPQEECTVFAKGRAKAGGERFKLKKTKERFLDAGEKAKLRLKPKHLDQLTDLLADTDGKARIKVKGTDAGGNTAKKKLKVELTG